MNTSKSILKIIVYFFLVGLNFSCATENKNEQDESTAIEKLNMTAKDILGNPEYLAISYGGYRKTTRDITDQPTLEEIKDDLKLLSAMGIRVIRTYNVQLPQAFNILNAIRQLKEVDPDFEMYVMLGAWIDCKNAWTELQPDHSVESEQNESEIARAVALANAFSDIVKIIAVGNEAMVNWAASYYVQPGVILKWVNHLQDLKATGKLNKEVWVTSSDDFSSWGGGGNEYHTPELEALYKAVDYISMHTYPYHNSHYNPQFWGVPEAEEDNTDLEKIDAAMKRALNFAKDQYDSVTNYMKSLGINKPIHIGETGWATVSNGQYGPSGSRATDEYKEAKFHELLREWTNDAGISCFYFEAFDEPWKDAHNSKGSENHFGLFTVNGQAKYALWSFVDDGVFKGLSRNGNSITKTYGGDEQALMQDVLTPPSALEIAVK